jgi:thioesterase domain-containing protein
VQPEGPYYLTGLCVNGVIAYEMARQLVAQGERIALLVLFDAQNPAYYEDFSQESRAWLLRKRISFQLSNLRNSGISGFPDFMRDRLIGIRRRLSVRYWRACHAFHVHVKMERLEDLENIVHPASFVYRPEPYPGRVVFFQSTDWPKGRYWDFHASWDGMISGGLEVYKIRGGHESMFYQSNVATLADKLQACLNEAQRNHPTTVTSFPAPRLLDTEFLSPVSRSKTQTAEGL